MGFFLLRSAERDSLMYILSPIPSVGAMCLIHLKLDPSFDYEDMLTWVQTNQTILFVLLVLTVPLYIIIYALVNLEDPYLKICRIIKKKP